MSTAGRIRTMSRVPDAHEEIDPQALAELLQHAIDDLQSWVREQTEEPAALNLLWLHDGELVGSRLRRSLWSLERSEPIECDICGDVHAQPPEKEAYRVVVVASERITDEDWFGLSLPDSTRRVCAVSFFRLAVSIPEVQILPTTNRLGAFDKEPSQRRQDPEPRICTELAA